MPAVRSSAVAIAAAWSRTTSAAAGSTSVRAGTAHVASAAASATVRRGEHDLKAPARPHDPRNQVRAVVVPALRRSHSPDSSSGTAGHHAVPFGSRLYSSREWDVYGRLKISNIPWVIFRVVRWGTLSVNSQSKKPCALNDTPMNMFW